MTDISEDAYILLKTARKRALRAWGGKVFDKSRIAAWYNEDEDDSDWISALQLQLDELLVAKLIDYEDRDDKTDGYQITPKGEDYTRPVNTSPSIIQSFSNIHSSNIANLSSNAVQNLDLSTYATEIQEEVNELSKAAKSNDHVRAKRIIDGLWI